MAGYFELKMDGPTLGAIIGVVFGFVWGVGGATGLPHPWRGWALGLSTAISLGLIAALLLPHSPRSSGAFRGRTYALAVAFEGVAIFVTAWLLNRFALSQFLLPTIGFIVGLHFMGLWKATDQAVFLWTAVSLCVVCLLAAFLPTVTAGGTHAKAALAGLGSAVVLWAAAVTTLWRHAG